MASSALMSKPVFNVSSSRFFFPCLACVATETQQQSNDSGFAMRVRSNGCGHF